MNLNAYELIEISPYVSHIDVHFKKLYTCNIKYHKYYAYLTRYNSEEDNYDLFILLTNTTNNKDLVYHSTIGNINSKRLSFDAKPISGIIKSKFNFKVYIEQYEIQEDCIIYRIRY